MAERLQTAIRLIYPPACLACGGRVDSDFGLCGPCWTETPFITGLVCDACGTPLPGEGDRDRALCDTCLRVARPWARGRAAMLYSGSARRMVLALKHGDRHDIARPGADWLARSAAPLLTPDTVIVPVPLHTLRLLRRRYNQSALLALALGRQTGCTVLADALVRTARTPSLDGKTREERFAALDGTIRVTRSRRDRIAGRPVLIVDDVMTSGATFAAATEAMHEAGATEVCVAALARVGKDA
ncbi:double zinc ribbon domain-containing protein [Roseivivax sediminis]|uniref:double zinc ribbon domain-containing protein n=1 Tax=Roseivivax sediminis TaxID=936889 RepID=UPI001CB75879